MTTCWSKLQLKLPGLAERELEAMEGMEDMTSAEVEDKARTKMVVKEGYTTNAAIAMHLMRTPDAVRALF
jgi:hypothetical protein